MGLCCDFPMLYCSSRTLKTDCNWALPIPNSWMWWILAWQCFIWVQWAFAHCIGVSYWNSFVAHCKLMNEILSAHMHVSPFSNSVLPFFLKLRLEFAQHTQMHNSHWQIVWSRNQLFHTSGWKLHSHQGHGTCKYEDWRFLVCALMILNLYACAGGKLEPHDVGILQPHACKDSNNYVIM